MRSAATSPLDPEHARRAGVDYAGSVHLLRGHAMIRQQLFRDRADAAHQLATRLSSCRGSRPLVLAIPRGAVPMGQRIARELQGELDVVLVRKLGAPFSEEYAIGAIDESGWVYRSPLAAAAGADE